MDAAFVKHGFNKLNEDDMASETAIKFLLNHFIKGRLYDRHLKHDEVFESIGGNGLKIQRLGVGKTITNWIENVLHLLYRNNWFQVM